MRHMVRFRFDYTAIRDHEVGLNSQMADYEGTLFCSMPNSIASIHDNALNWEHASTC